MKKCTLYNTREVILSHIPLPRKEIGGIESSIPPHLSLFRNKGRELVAVPDRCTRVSPFEEVRR